MGEIQRPGALYQQVAAEIRSGISAGEYTPGAPLPSEAQLIDRYRVSRPTVRKAIAALRAEGLIEVIHGKGSYVRAVPAPAVTIERTITRSGKNFRTGHHAWQRVEAPTIYRTTTTATTGPLLELAEGEALFAVDRLLSDPDTETRALHRVLIPFATAAETEQLGKAPDTEPERIYAIFTAAGHKLTWDETVGARMPLPDERAALQIPDATPILHATLVTLGTDRRPLILEELRTSADRAQLAYRNLARAYESTGDLSRAITLHEQALTDQQQVLGEEHPSTLTARTNLARAYESAGDLSRAIPLYEQTLTESVRLLGDDHLSTLTARTNLARAYESAGDLSRAIPLYEQTLTESVRLLGDDHLSTLTARTNLARAYESAGDLSRAIPLYEQTLTESVRLLGDDHPHDAHRAR